MSPLLALLAAAALSPQAQEDPWSALWRRLLEQGDEVLRQETLDRICDSGTRAARVAARYFELRTDSVRKLIERLDADDVAERDAATLALVEVGRAAEDLLRDAAESGSAEVKSRARDLLARIAALRKTGPARPLLDDLLAVLGKTGGRAQLKYVTPFFDSTDPRVRERALQAAAQLAGSGDLGVFEKILMGEDPGLRLRAVAILAETGGEKGEERLRRLLREDSQWAVLRAAEEALRKKGIPIPADHSLRMAERAATVDGEARTRLLAQALWGPSQEGLYDKVSAVLAGSDAAVRRGVLALVDESDALMAARFLADPDPALREQARGKLERFIENWNPNRSPTLWLPADLARKAVLSRDAGLRAGVKGLLYEGPRAGSWGIEEAAARGDLELTLAAAFHLPAGDSPRLRESLRKLREPLPAGRERNVLDAALALAGAPVEVPDALFDDPDPVAVGMAIRAAPASPRLREFLAGHAGTIAAAAFRPDGKTFLTAGHDRALILWDAERGVRRKILEGHAGKIQALAVSPDGRIALTAGADRILIAWDLEKGESLRTLKGHEDAVTAVSFFPDGRSALSGSADGAVIVWDVEKGIERERFEPYPGAVTSLAVAPDGRRAAAGGTGPVLVWDAGSGVWLNGFPAGPRSMAVAVVYAPDGRLFGANSDKTAARWDPDLGTRVREFQGHGMTATSLALSPDARRLLTGSVDRTAILWETETGKRLADLRGHASWVNAVALSPDGRRALTGGQDGECIVWDLSTGTLKFRRGHRGILERALEAAGSNRDAALVADLARLAAGADGVLRPKALGALVKIGDPNAASALVAALSHADPAVRPALLQALGGMALVRLPEGWEKAPFMGAEKLFAERMKQAVDARGKMPELLRAAARGDRNASTTLANAGLAAIRVRIGEGDGFAEDGALNVPEDLLAELLTVDPGLVTTLLKNSGLRAMPKKLRELSAAGDGVSWRAISACHEAGLADVVGAAFELLEKGKGVEPPAGLVHALARADASRTREWVERTISLPLDERKVRSVLQAARALPDRMDLLLRLMEHVDRPLALGAAVGIGNRAEVRRRAAEGRITDTRVLFQALEGEQSVEDLPLFRKIVAEPKHENAWLAAIRLVHLGGEAEVEHVLPMMREEKGAAVWNTPRLVAPWVGPRHRAALEKMLESADFPEKRPIRLLLLRAGRTDTLGDALDEAPKGTYPSEVVAYALQGVRVPEVRTRALALAETWEDPRSTPVLWAALLDGDVDLVARQVEPVAAKAGTPELRRAVLAWLVRRWKPEFARALGLILSGAGIGEVDGPMARLSTTHRDAAARAALEAAPALLRTRGDQDLLARVIAAGDDRAALAPKILELHADGVGGITLSNRVELALAASRGGRDERLEKLLRVYFGSHAGRFGGDARDRILPLSSRLQGAESLAAIVPEPADLAETARRLALSARVEDRAVAAHYRFRRGTRLTEEEWFRTGPSEASLFLAVESRLGVSAREALTRYREHARDPWRDPECRHFAACFTLLASQDFDAPLSYGEKDAAPRRERFLGRARDWVLDHAEKTFEDSFGEALRDAGYRVAGTPGAKDRDELLRALRDPRWYLARNALWMLQRLALEGKAWKAPSEDLDARGPTTPYRPEPPAPWTVEAWEAALKR